MDYTYIVETEIRRFHENEADGTFEEFKPKLFKGSNPLSERQKAFDCAQTFKDILAQADKQNVEKFFESTDKDVFNKEFDVSVYFINPETGEKSKIHSSETLQENDLINGSVEYDPISMRWFIKELEKEYNILTSKGISSDTKLNLRLTFMPAAEIITATIFSTPWINWTSKNMQDLVL